jgi:hypothetical protein
VAGQQVLFSEAASKDWTLGVAGHGVPRRTAFGWANLYSVTAGGQARLRYRTPPLRVLELLVEVALWVLAGRTVIAARRRRRVDGGSGEGPSDAGTDDLADPDAPTGTVRLAVPLPAPAVEPAGTASSR